MSHFRPWDILNLVKNSIRYKNKGSSADPNLLSDSTKKQWEIQAKQWNDFVGTYEPRIDYAQQFLTRDISKDIRGAVRSALFDQYDVNKAFAQPQVNENAILRGTGDLGSKLAKTDIGASEQAKDAQVSNITSALNTLQGATTSTAQGLDTISNQAIQSQMQGIKTNFDTQAKTSAITSGTLGTAAATGIGLLNSKK